ncbi:MAG: hypothetical protein WC848_02620 [Parcubacteria group bacterium]
MLEIFNPKNLHLLVQKTLCDFPWIRRVVQKILVKSKGGEHLILLKYISGPLAGTSLPVSGDIDADRFLADLVSLGWVWEVVSCPANIPLDDGLKKWMRADLRARLELLKK